MAVLGRGRTAASSSRTGSATVRSSLPQATLYRWKQSKSCGPVATTGTRTPSDMVLLVVRAMRTSARRRRERAARTSADSVCAALAVAGTTAHGPCTYHRAALSSVAAPRRVGCKQAWMGGAHQALPTVAPGLSEPPPHLPRRRRVGSTCPARSTAPARAQDLVLSNCRSASTHQRENARRRVQGGVCEKACARKCTRGAQQTWSPLNAASALCACHLYASASCAGK